MFTLVDGVLTKKTVASVYEGQIEKFTVECLLDFVDVLMSLGQNQCLVYGEPAVSPAGLVTEEEWHKLGRPRDKLPRTKSAITWSNGPGILLLDYDAPKDGSPLLSREELIALLNSALDGNLAAYDYVWWPSTSSCIYDGDTKLAGVKGQRIYLMVEDARDIERAGKVLCDRIWATGYGRFEVSKSGSLLERSLFDASVWQSNHIDFAAGASCSGTLTQRRGDPYFYQGFLGLGVDTAIALPALTAAELAQANEHKKVAREGLRKEAELAREIWLNDRAQQIIKSKHPPGAKIEVSEEEVKEARKTALRAVERRELMGDWVVTVIEDGKRIELSVLALLDNPERYHGRQTLDPLEPDYDGGRTVGKLFLMSARPTLYSMAHGGASYKLHRQPQNIELVRGKMHEITNALLDVLRRSPAVFDFGTELVTLGDNGKMLTTDRFSLQYLVSGLTQFWHWWKPPNGDPVPVNEDPPGNVTNAVLSLGASRLLKPLDSVITAPTLRLDGTLLDIPGYDRATRLLLIGDGKHPHVPMCPTTDEARLALELLWDPFKEFPFVDALDRAVHLSALLTAAVRPVLPKSPAFAYDAPIQASGKTLLASCVGVLVTGDEPETLPPISAHDDEEVRKRLFAALRGGSRVIFWDNVVGTLDSPAMAAMITASNYSDRVLGQSIQSTVPNRAMLLLSGNNFSAAGDLARRILVARIDPGTDRPFAREFSLNPLAVCLTYRQEKIAAALTLIRYHLQHDNSLGAGQLASFEDWDRMVRQTVIRANELLPGQFADVMARVILNQECDPEQESVGQLLRVWRLKYGDKSMTAQDVIHGFDVYPLDTGCDISLRDCFKELAPNVQHFTPRIVGNVLKYRKDRIVGGLRLRARKTGDKTYWSVA